MLDPRTLLAAVSLSAAVRTDPCVAVAARARDAHAAMVDSARLQPRSVAAAPLDGAPPRIDGRLDEDVWARLFADPRNVARDFVEQSPRPGAVPTLPTFAVFAYDGDALYVAVRACDPHPDSIVAPYPRRDFETRSDWIFVEIDTRHDRRTAWSMGVNPRGVQVDGTFARDNVYDTSWNGVWESAAAIDSAGWTVEYRVPFAQLRVPTAKPGTALVRWGVNVYRFVARRGENSNWSPRLPTLAGVVSHFNDLTGITLPTGGHSLDVRPYTLVRSEPLARLSTTGPQTSRDASTSTGVDATARLGDGLSLDVALHPDFGQVEADPSEINLTTFETYFTERRPLFANAADIFDYTIGVPYVTRGDDFSAEQAFYSRRIGAAPHASVPASAVAAVSPTASTLAGAAKISGRTSSGWTVGALLARTDAARARYLDAGDVERSLVVEPGTTFGAARLARDFDDGGTAVGGFLTGVERDLGGASVDSLLVRRAVFAGLDGRRRFDAQRYELTALAGVSAIAGSAPAIARVLSGPGHYLQRPHGPGIDSAASTASGAVGRLTFARVGGSRLTWSVTGYGVTPRFDVDEAGFQRNADWLLALATVTYERRPSGGWFRRWAVGSDQLAMGWTTAGERRTTTLDAKVLADFWNYWHVDVTADWQPTGLATELLRGGPAVRVPPHGELRLNIDTDARRATQFGLATTLMRERGSGSGLVDVAPSVTSRVTDRLALTGGIEAQRSTNGWQYVTRVPDSDSAPSHLLARLRQHTLSLTARADYAFSARLTLQGYVQPYLGAGRYDRPALADGAGHLASVRRLDPTEVRTTGAGWEIRTRGSGSSSLDVPRANFGVRELHGNAVLRWEYRPGSELYLVWTQARSDADADGLLAVRRDLGTLFRAPPQNVLLLKLSYDWQP